MNRFTVLYAAMIFASPVSASAQSGSESSELLAEFPDCPARIRVLGEPPGDPIECLCTPEIRTTEGTVKLYGSGPYDSVSNICIAAVHAGVTTLEGGPVRVIPRPPQSSFKGTLANGVYSEDWGSSKFNTFDVEPVKN
ncbi:LCCL domain-containing protein [Defluviimonas sp. WL0024]|uniref:LCCL domain-containing protein n=1 Tax=Albidovulum salinarum TaxID=2984153 RepID=A0ABT2X5K5_9RHOB|nr:LCCL domain-containing protein [Defluviimonas sp. WL0024]MCU9849188.1 LCCL domain-containing protein [Defluviimonas sp. WL0024]